MPANQPAEIHALFQAAFNAHDATGLSELYEESAVLVTGPGTTARGRGAIGNALQSFFAMKPVMRLETASVLEGDGLALLEGKWVLIGVGSGGDPVQITGTSREVVRRQPDGTWLYTLDDPGAGR
jgi:uncharacterized protein (TIGR02246 family)